MMWEVNEFLKNEIENLTENKIYITTAKSFNDDVECLLIQFSTSIIEDFDACLNLTYLSSYNIFIKYKSDKNAQNLMHSIVKHLYKLNKQKKDFNKIQSIMPANIMFDGFDNNFYIYHIQVDILHV